MSESGKKNKEEVIEKGLKLKLMKIPMPKAPGSTVSNPSKVGSQTTVKTPKMKSMPDATDKPSVFFKSEYFGTIKKPSIEKLRAFLERTRSKR